MLVWNVVELEEFFDMMLRPLDERSVYVMWLVARKKWGFDGRSEEMLDYKILREYDFDKFYSLIQRFDVPEDAYVSYNSGRPIPKDVMGIYIDLQQKDVIRGVSRYLSSFVSDVGEGMNDRGRLRRIKYWDRKIFGEIHKSNAEKRPFFMIDVDDKDLFWDIIDIIGEDLIYWITETRGGYHIFIPRKKGREFAEVREDLMKLGKVEIPNHNQTVVCGTIQGGFKTRRVLI